MKLTKTIFAGAIIVFTIAWFISGLFKQLTDQPLRTSNTMNGKDAKHQRYVQGHEEIITFFAREHAQSDHMIARKGILIRRPNAKYTVFIFHGFMCNKSDVRFLTNALFGQSLGDQPFNTLTIDFRAHGENTCGQCCSFGCNEMYDVLGAIEFAKADAQLKKTHRIAYGFSMGAVASILAQAEDPTLFEMAVWDCPFESTENVLGRAIERLKLSAFGYELPLPGRSLLHKYAYNNYVQNVLKFALKTVAKMDASQVDTCIAPVDTVAAMKKISIPLMLISCKKDEKVPLSAIKQLYDAARGYKRLWITNGRNHFDSYFYNPEKYIYKVRRFIQKIIDGTYKSRYQNHITEDK